MSDRNGRSEYSMYVYRKQQREQRMARKDSETGSLNERPQNGCNFTRSNNHGVGFVFKLPWFSALLYLAVEGFGALMVGNFKSHKK